MLHVQRAGEQGPTLVLLHGWLRSVHAWRHLFAPLATVARVVAIDLPGFGRSPILEGEYDHAFFADAVWAELEGEGDLHLVGHGLGGATAFAMALARPASVRSIVAVSPTVLKTPLLGLRGRFVTSSIVGRTWLQVAPRRAIRHMLEPHFHDQAHLDEALLDEVMGSLERPGAREVAHRALVTDLGGALAERVADVTVPTTLIWGYNDRIQPLDVARTLISRIRGATLRQIPNTGYGALECRPRSVARYITDAFGLPLPHGIPDGHPAP
jgi:pyruvate dehydrogenase E2 component (dihydrolipoamide acetyltransferase)